MMGRHMERKGETQIDMQKEIGGDSLCVLCVPCASMNN